MTSLAARVIVNLLYRSPFNPKSSDSADDAVVALVEGDRALKPGRALDLGCGRGRHSIYLAKHDWEVTGIDLVSQAITEARSKAAAAGVRPRLIHGDVTELDKLDIPTGHTLVVDAGCFHGLPNKMRDAYVPGVTRVAAPGAILVMLGLAKHPVIKGMNEAELRSRFNGWELVGAEHVAGDEMLRYGDGSAWLHKAFEKGWFDPWRYTLRRTADKPGMQDAGSVASGH